MIASHSSSAGERLAWRADSIHAVIFAAPGAPVDAHSLWTRMIGSPPASFQQAPPNGSSAVGPWESFQLTISTAPGRNELALAQAPTGPSEGPPTMDDPSPALEALEQLASKLFAFENPTRVSVVANLHTPVESAQKAAKMFSELSRVPGVPDDASDLIFAANVKKPIGSAGWTMNRVVKWATEVRQLITLTITPSGMAPSVTKENHVVSLTLDINTVPRQIPLGQTQAASSFRDLVSEVRNLMTDTYDHLLAS